MKGSKSKNESENTQAAHYAIKAHISPSFPIPILLFGLKIDFRMADSQLSKGISHLLVK